jgi:hypothetical protein
MRIKKTFCIAKKTRNPEGESSPSSHENKLLKVSIRTVKYGKGGYMRIKTNLSYRQKKPVTLKANPLRRRMRIKF